MPIHIQGAFKKNHEDKRIRKTQASQIGGIFALMVIRSHFIGKLDNFVMSTYLKRSNVPGQ